MSPVEILPPVYLESRLAAETAKRRNQEEAASAAAAAAAQKNKDSATDLRSKERNKTAMKPNAHSPTYLQAGERLRSPNITQAMLQRPTLSRPASSGFLGNVYQGFVRAAYSAPGSQHGSAATTPTVEKAEPSMRANVEIEKMIAEKKRDADICAMPAWYH